MIFFNKNNKINLKKIVLIIGLFFSFLIINFNFNNVFGLVQNKNIDSKEKNVLNKNQDTDEDSIISKYNFLNEIVDEEIYLQIEKFIKKEIKRILLVSEEPLNDNKDISEKCMTTIMENLKKTYLSFVIDTRNQMTKTFFKIFFIK